MDHLKNCPCKKADLQQNPPTDSRKLTHGTAFVDDAAKSFNRLKEETSAVEKHEFAFFESAEHSPHSTGNIAQRFSISFQRKSFWAIEIDRNMGQRANQVVLEK
jgi:hypothetical protein